jgi:hypothetical protein
MTMPTPRGPGSAHGPAGPPVPDLETTPTKSLLRLYGQILTELIRRGVVRSRNAPAGDLAEALVARAYGGQLAAKSEKSWDVSVIDHKIQVKCRVVDAGARRTQQFSPFRSWGFDICVFVLLDSLSYDVVRALEIDVADVQATSKRVDWVAASRISVAQVLAFPGVTDVTQRLQSAYADLDSDLSTPSVACRK